MPRCIAYASRSSSTPTISENGSRVQANLKLLTALWNQAEKETLPWVKDLITPWFAGPPAPLTGTTAPQALADVDSHFMKVGIVDVHYKEVLPQTGTLNSSSAILLLHGFNGSTFNWRLVMQQLADRTGLRVVAFDRPPFGLSSRPLEWGDEQDNPYAAGAGARLAVGLMDGLGIQKAVLVGHSAGAAIAVDAALRYPDRVSSLVLVSPAVPVDDSNFLRQAGLGQQLRYAYTRMLLSTDSPALNYVRRSVTKRSEQVKAGELGIYYDETSVPTEVIDGYLKPMQADNWDRGYLLMLRAFSTPAPPSWKDVHQPVLLVQGENDQTTTTPRVKRLLDRIRAEQPAGVPLAGYTELACCGHLPSEERPSEFISAIVDYQPLFPTAVEQVVESTVETAVESAVETAVEAATQSAVTSNQVNADADVTYGP